MRKAIKGLSIVVADYLDLNVFFGNFFVFCNRNRIFVKIRYWDRNGFCLWQKRFEKHRFSWPESEGEVLELSHRQLRWILDGLDPMQVK